ncbi:MAG: general secretion pathway protein GspB [Gammaproteobacteria bacterium]|nr:general secretion pathway protein GspB [Gammaproteobacteria bacterium]
MRKQAILRIVVGTTLIVVANLCLGAEFMSDPTRPYTARELSAATTSRFVVNAIIISPERRVAIVNGRRVSVGDSVGNATVIAIEKEKMVLELDGKRITTGLHDGASRQ